MDPPQAENISYLAEFILASRCEQGYCYEDIVIKV
jgi:hypothetical protein